MREFENYRRYRRYSVSGRAEISDCMTARPLEKTIRGEVKNISQGGMGFSTSERIDTGTPVAIEVCLGILERPDLLYGRIASTCRDGDSFFTGVEFDEEIPYERFLEIVG